MRNDRSFISVVFLFFYLPIPIVGIKGSKDGCFSATTDAPLHLWDVVQILSRYVVEFLSDDAESKKSLLYEGRTKEVAYSVCNDPNTL